MWPDDNFTLQLMNVVYQHCFTKYCITDNITSKLYNLETAIEAVLISSSVMLAANLRSASHYLPSKYQFVVEFLEIFKCQISQFWLHFLPQIINKTITLGVHKVKCCAVGSKVNYFATAQNSLVKFSVTFHPLTLWNPEINISKIHKIPLSAVS